MEIIILLHKDKLPVGPRQARLHSCFICMALMLDEGLAIHHLIASHMRRVGAPLSPSQITPSTPLDCATTANKRFPQIKTQKVRVNRPSLNSLSLKEVPVSNSRDENYAY